jgi:hypothetical protein
MFCLPSGPHLFTMLAGLAVLDTSVMSVDPIFAAYQMSDCGQVFWNFRSSFNPKKSSKIAEAAGGG